MPKTNAQKLVDKRLDEFEQKMLDMVEKRNQKAVSKMKEQNRLLSNEIGSMKAEVKKAHNRITEDAKQLALDDFKALRGEISELKQAVQHFDPTAEEAEALDKLIADIRAREQALGEHIEGMDSAFREGLQNVIEYSEKRTKQTIEEIEEHYWQQWDKENPFDRSRWDKAFRQLTDFLKSKNRHRLFWMSVQFLFTVFSVFVSLYIYDKWILG